MDISDNSKTKGVIAVPQDKLVQNYILNKALETHKNLTLPDRSFAVREILRMDLSKKDLAKFILQIFKLTNTGRFSLTYNYKLDKNIKDRDTQKLSELVKIADTEKAWPELYNNSYLTQPEVETIKSMNNREYYAILNTIQKAGSKDLNNIIPCKPNPVAEPMKNTVIKQTTVDNDIIYYNSIYTKCYDNVCLHESEQKGKIVSVSGTKSSIPQIAYVSDKSNNYCFSLMELVERFAMGNYDNPKTGTRFSNRTLSQVISKYNKEINMYRQYLDILIKNDQEEVF